MANASVLIIAGDPSGDLHASNLITALKQSNPSIRISAVGGPLCRAVADEFIEDLASRGMTGFWEPLLRIGFLIGLGGRLKRHLRERRPSALICVDFYGFNSRILAYAKEVGVPAFYFVGPQVWASRPGRIGVLKRLVSKMFVIFPFEENLYRAAGVPVEFVGHPLLDLIAPPEEARPNGEPLTLGLLPGSRPDELRRHLPIFYESFKILRRKHPDMHGLLFAPAGRDETIYGDIPEGVALIHESDYTRRRSLDLAICSSGTATLENALLGVPMVVVYKMSWPTYWIARALIRVKHIAMANLLAGETIVPELIQDAARPDRIAAEASAILGDADRAKRIRNQLLSVRRSLGHPGACERAAAGIVSWIKTN